MMDSSPPRQTMSLKAFIFYLSIISLNSCAHHAAYDPGFDCVGITPEIAEKLRRDPGVLIGKGTIGDAGTPGTFRWLYKGSSKCHSGRSSHSSIFD